MSFPLNINLILAKYKMVETIYITRASMQGGCRDAQPVQDLCVNYATAASRRGENQGCVIAFSHRQAIDFYHELKELAEKSGFTIDEDTDFRADPEGWLYFVSRFQVSGDERNVFIDISAWDEEPFRLALSPAIAAFLSSDLHRFMTARGGI